MTSPIAGQANAALLELNAAFRANSRGPSLAEIAVHEAAHAVVALIVGERIGEMAMSYDSDGMWSGFVVMQSAPRTGISRRRALRVVDVYTAGEVGAARYARRRMRQLPGRWEGDRADVREVILLSGGPLLSERRLDALIRERVPGVASMLDANWDAVTMIALELLDFGVVSAARVRRIFRDAVAIRTAR